MSTYVNLLIEWNQRLNLVAPSTIPGVWRRHVLDSAQLAPLIPSHARTIIDLGSGAGFPGMVLAIMLDSPSPLRGGAGVGVRAAPHASTVADNIDSEDPHPYPSPQGGEGTLIHLVESTQKKCRFLEEVAKATAAPVKVHWTRAEDLKGLKADVVTARALAPLDRLLALAHPFFTSTTTGLFLKGRSLNDELTRARESWRFAYLPIPSRSDPSGTVLRVTGLSPWRRSQKHS